MKPTFTEILAALEEAQLNARYNLAHQTYNEFDTLDLKFDYDDLSDAIGLLRRIAPRTDSAFFKGSIKYK